MFIYGFWYKVGLLNLLHCLSHLGTMNENLRWKTTTETKPMCFFGSVDFLVKSFQCFTVSPLVIPAPTMHMHAQLCMAILVFLKAARNSSAMQWQP